MSAEAEADRTLRNLTLLSLVKQNDKLETMGDGFSIYPPTSLRGLVRRWQGEHREANIQRVQECVTSACTYIGQARDELLLAGAAAGLATATGPSSGPSAEPSAGAPGSLAQAKRHHLRLRCDRLQRSLADCRAGIRNLIDTYSDDTAAAVRLRLLIQQIDDFLRVCDGGDSDGPPAVRPRRGHGAASPPALSLDDDDFGGRNGGRG